MDSVISSIVTSIWTPMVDEIKYLPKIGENMRNLKKVSGDLQLTKNEVQKKIKRALEIADDEEPTERVLKWQKQVQTMEDDVNKIEQDHAKLKMCLGGFPLNCWSGYKISKRATNTAEDVKELIKEKDDMHVVTKKVVRDVQPKTDRSELLPTTQVYLMDAIKHLQDDMTGMVGILGMGGVGKTTLLTKINNDPYVANAGGFLVIWVVVSQELNLHKLQRDIAKRISLRLEPEGDSTFESRAASLSHCLQQQNKKILLLLDDLWKSFDLEKLGIPCHGVNKDNVPNCKVVFTTRSEMVCDQMMAMHKFHAQARHRKIKLEGLKGEEAWQLFLNNIGETARNIVSSDDRVYNYAKKVAEKCSGLPLTLVLIAKSMSSNSTLYDWEDAVNSINKLGIQELLGEETAESVFRLLKVSYDRLEDERLRKCFLTCALWPEDYRIPRDVLIWSWLGLDLIAGREFDDIKEAFTRGHSIIQRLERAGLLLDAGEEPRPFQWPFFIQYVKLHDIIREMALWIATDYGKNRNKWLVQVAGVHNKATEAAEEEQKWSEVEMAFTVGSTLRLPHKPCCPNLTALMLRGDFSFFQNVDYDPNTILDSFFQNMVALTYLDLANSRLREVPSEITTLSQLQYLNLAGNDIDQLPKELSNLKKLKYLILGGTYFLKHIPRGLLSGLEKLEVLDLFVSGYTKWGMESEASIEELAGGTMAPGVNNLKGLGIEVANMSALQLLTEINPPITLWKLNILGLVGVEILDLSKTLLRSNRALRSLQSLLIVHAGMKEILMTSEENRQFEKLSFFSLLNLYELTKITWKGGITPGELFANLSEVKIDNCKKLCDVTWIAQLRHLEILQIGDCRMLEKVLTDGANQEKDHDDDDDDVGVEQEERRATTMILPNLRHLSLKYLPNLKSFCSPEIRFPKLKPNCVRIIDCPQLDKTPFMKRWPLL